MSENATERTAAATPGTLVEPHRAYQFSLEFSGYPGIQGHFTSVAGLTVEIDDIQYRQGGDRQIVHHMPGQVRYGPVELRYGVTSERVLWDWIRMAAAGQPVRQNVSVRQLDSRGQAEVLRWNLMDAFPTYFSYGVLDAHASQLVIAKLVLAVGTIDLA